jgi:hypothetical protein
MARSTAFSGPAMHASVEGFLGTDVRRYAGARSTARTPLREPATETVRSRARGSPMRRSLHVAVCSATAVVLALSQAAPRGREAQPRAPTDQCVAGRPVRLVHGRRRRVGRQLSGHGGRAERVGRPEESQARRHGLPTGPLVRRWGTGARGQLDDRRPHVPREHAAVLLVRAGRGRLRAGLGPMGEHRSRRHGLRQRARDRRHVRAQCGHGRHLDRWRGHVD